MRLLLDTLIAVMLVGILAGFVLHHRHEKELEENIRLCRAEVQRFQSQIMLQAALESTALTARGYPVKIDPAWFGDSLPMNPMVPAGHPWLEIASEEDRNRAHPVNVMAIRKDTAQFWYNPYKGIVRARVSDDLTQARARQLYERINEIEAPHVARAE